MKRLFSAILTIAAAYGANAQSQNIYICKDAEFLTKEISVGLELSTESDSVVFARPAYLHEQGAAFKDTVYVHYSGNTATVYALPESSITAKVSGANVTLTNTILDREIVTVLSGKSDAGSFVYSGDYKTTIVLNGLQLKAATAEAINVKDGKRIAIVLAPGTENRLEDVKKDGGQKSALYSKGHFEFSGAGTLELVGNVKHALSSKEYIQVKKSVGTINITSAASDGIHCAQYFQMNGGTLNVTGVGSDGIQVDAAEDGEKNDGQILINGGNIYVNAAADCIKADSCIYFNGGNTVCYSTGNDAVDSNAGKVGAITIGNGNVFAYTTFGDPEEGFGCDNNAFVQVTGEGVAITAGGNSTDVALEFTISNATQGYKFSTSTIPYKKGTYYTLSDTDGKNIVTYSFEADCNSTLSFFTAKGMESGKAYSVKQSTTEPSDATTSWHGLYLGSSAKGSDEVVTFEAH